MSDIGIGTYYPVPGIYGTANPATDSDPISRAELQEQSFMAAQAIKESLVGHYVPQSYLRPGHGVLPIVGWTVQNSVRAIPFPPYTAEGVGQIPDWTGDANPLAGGSYDQTQVVAYGDYNPLNQGPIGTPFWDAPGADLPSDPNTVAMYAQGGLGDLEW